MNKERLIIFLVVIFLMFNIFSRRTKTQDDPNKLLGALWQKDENSILVYALNGKYFGELVEVDKKSDMASLNIGEKIEFNGEYIENGAEINKFKADSFEVKTNIKNIDGDINKAQKVVSNSKSAVILDVRTFNEYKGGHLPGAINIALDKIGTDAEFEIEEKDTPILVYCRSGARSQSAKAILEGLGYELVINIGGIMNYKGDLEN
ncbi:MAG: rhodanese-like domain-containing protein [Tissierellia bacterium]|nr:rhodanese-like domain-containing protein [Tissierellia bacterium]